jgi:hypothetical protein
MICIGVCIENLNWRPQRDSNPCCRLERAIYSDFYYPDFSTLSARNPLFLRAFIALSLFLQVIKID